MTIEADDASSPAKRLASLSTSAIADAAVGARVFAPGLIRYSGVGTIAGKAVTADCAEGSTQAIFAALEHAKAGDILVINGPGETAYLGDMLATNLVNLGLIGAIVDGFVRDRAAIATMRASFFGRGLCPVNLRRRTPGVAMQQIKVGGVDIEPGDWIIADDDGVLALSPDRVEETLAKAKIGEQIEIRIREYLEEGMNMPDAVRKAVAEVSG